MTKQEQAMRLYKAVERFALQAGEDTDEAIDWLCGEHGGMFKLYEAYFSPKPPQRKPLTDEQVKTRTDEQIEATFKRCGGKWNGDHWVIEDADLHPFVRTIEGPELNTLRAISDEYNAWIKHHAAGHSYDDFLAKREAAHGIKGDA